MKKHGLRLLAGVMTLLLLLTNAGGTVSAFAENDNAAEKKQERVLVVTQDMVGKNGKLTIEGEWDEIILPKEIEASQMTFKNVKVGKIEVESGTMSKIKVTSGEVGTISVVPADRGEEPQVDIRDLIQLTGDALLALEKYQELQKEQDKISKSVPTITTGNGVTVTEVKVTGNAKLELGKGVIESLTVDSDGSMKKLDVNVSNYSGKVMLKQKDREDGTWTIAKIKLKNTKVDSLTMEGEGSGNLVLSGQNSEVKEAKVENSPYITLNVPTETVEIGEAAAKTQMVVVTKVDSIQVTADGAKLEVGGAGSVESATVEGDNVVISGEGTLKNVDITGKGAYVSTFGTVVKGVNNYVATTEVGLVRDLGGLKIVIGDWFTDESAVPTTQEELARQAYREALMEKYNFTVERKKVVTDWNQMLDAFTKSVQLGDPIAQVVILDHRFVLGNRGLCYDLSTLSELDFSDDKWNDSVRAFMSYGTGIYGMSDDAAKSEPRGGVIFNKAIFEQAGLDPNLPYELQKTGEWTWSRFYEICEQIDNNTADDVYATASRAEALLKGLVVSTGEWLVAFENGQYSSNLSSEKVKEAVKFADDLRNAGFVADCQSAPGVSEDDWYNNYDYHRKLFREGNAAMQFAEEWYLTTSPDYGLYCGMENLGFVCYPKQDGEANYHTYFADNVAVIPACYDAQTAADIAFAYNLWTSPVPGVDVTEPTWKVLMNEYVDPRAIDETLEIFYQSGVAINLHCIDKGVGEEDYTSDNFFFSWPYDEECGANFDERYANKLAWHEDEMVGPLADANEEKRSEIRAPRPDGSVSEFLTCPYEVELKEDNTILLTERKDNTAAVVTIPSMLFRRNVTEIGANLFRQDAVVSVTIPNTVTTIDAYAFAECTALTTVNIPESVTTIGNEAFWFCTSLETLTIPESVQFIGASAFTDCNRNMKLKVVEGSYAARYAEENNVPYEYITE